MPSLKPYHTFGLDIQAHSILEIKSRSDCEDYIKLPNPKYLIGGGSDVFFSADFKGTIAIMKTKGIQIDEDENNYLVEAQGGENWHNLVEFLLNHNIPGLENLALIPGTCGAAPIQNIGAYGREFAHFCNYVEIINRNLQTIRYSVEECNFGYRTSIFKQLSNPNFIISAIGLRIPKKWKPSISYGALKQLENHDNLSAQEIFNTIISIRDSKIPRPEKIGSAGSFFKNPIVAEDIYQRIRMDYPNLPAYPQTDGQYKLAAGWLIEKCNLKGFRLKDAGVYDKQALIIVNYGQAKAEDIIQVVHTVIDRVYHVFGIKLEPEVRIIGETEELDPLQI